MVLVRLERTKVLNHNLSCWCEAGWAEWKCLSKKIKNKKIKSHPLFSYKSSAAMERTDWTALSPCGTHWDAQQVAKVKDVSEATYPQGSTWYNTQTQKPSLARGLKGGRPHSMCSVNMLDYPAMIQPSGFHAHRFVHEQKKRGEYWSSSGIYMRCMCEGVSK